ncbi:hypothetical protein GE09DRAFT_346060 [Coniochaeta sp. 2T2.1]|nr:hypothetical protein GE09DRAFT_346060 [Coniochaeta sp. 2T2.1]
MDASKLFSPVPLGRETLAHRIVMAPMTRRRATDDHIPTPIMVDYYRQRAIVPGTLLISEAAAVSPRAAARRNTPGIWSHEQVEAWKPVTAAVHARGSFIFLQMWMCGRAASPGTVKRGADLTSSGDVAIGPDLPAPRPMTDNEIRASISEWVLASKNAIEAGFDGVELHGANGYLLDQFTQETCNNRQDHWGGSVGNRSRYPLAVAKACAEAIGAERVGYRLSPWTKLHGMGLQDPIPQFTHLVTGLRDLKLGYLHMIESRVAGNADTPGAGESLDFLAKLWGNTSPIIFAGGYNAVTAREKAHDEQARGRQGLVAFGRVFISNPDLPDRIKDMLPVTRYNRDLFYLVGSQDGYTDYPLWEKQKDREGTEPPHVWPATTAAV